MFLVPYIIQNWVWVDTDFCTLVSSMTVTVLLKNSFGAGILSDLLRRNQHMLMIAKIMKKLTVVRPGIELPFFAPAFATNFRTFGPSPILKPEYSLVSLDVTVFLARKS